MRLAPWGVTALVVALTLSGVSFGLVLLSKRGCDGKATTITVVSSADQYKVMSGLAQRWQETKPDLDGKCITAVIARKDPAQVAAGLGPNWDSRRDGPRPDVWAPDSNAWLLVAADRPDAAAIVPSEPQSLAMSPVLIAMPQPMAKALGWPNAQLGWRDLVGKFGGGKSWADIAGGEASWGRFQIGMTNPATSTAGLHALFAITDYNNDSDVSDAELKSGLVFERTVSRYEPDMARIFDGLARADAESREKALTYVSAFPALEREILNYNATNPKVPLAAVYPAEGTVDANYPYAVLNAPWVDKAKQRIAQKFFEFLRTTEARRAYGEAGFRDTNRSTSYARELSTERGFQPQIKASARTMTLPASITRTVVTWSALRRRANILAVFDTSGSMAEPGIPGASKLQLVQLAAARAAGLYSDDTKVGVWEFSTKKTPTTDYRQIAPMAPMGARTGGVPNRVALVRALQQLRPKGGTGLYDTSLAAYQESKRRWEAGRINFVVILTDGKNEDDAVGLNLNQLLGRLKAANDPAKPVQIVTIAFGPDADVRALQSISRTTGGRTFVARSPADVEKIFLAALFGSR